jgi:hypothetical protein
MRSNFSCDGLKICRPPLSSERPCGNDAGIPPLTEVGYDWYV